MVQGQQSGTQAHRPKVFVNLPPALYSELFDAESDASLRELVDPTFRTDARNLTSEELAALIPGYEAIITGWGTPRFTDEVFATADRLRLIAHSAGTVKSMLPESVFQRGIAVTHASVALAPAVAEMSLVLILLSIRYVHKYDQAMKTGSRWEGQQTFGAPLELRGQRVGVISASYVGRQFISLLRGFQCDIRIYDPYLSEAHAAELGVTRASLEEVMSECSIISVHAPSTAETHHMLGAKQFAMMQDGAVLVNTARSWVLDEAALIAELETGRIRAALDVFEKEPLPLDSPFRKLDNVILTPHVAGASVQARYRQGATVVAEVARFLAGEPLQYGVTPERYAIIA